MGKSCYEKSEENTQYPTNNEISDEINRIFGILFSKKNKKITKEEFNNFLKYMKDYENQLYFLEKMNKARSFGRVQKDKFQYLKKIFAFIFNLFNLDNFSKEQLKIVQLILILSKTFYYDKGIIKTKKIYLIENLKSQTILKKIKFWRGLLEFIIKEDINNAKKNENFDLEVLKTNTAYGKMLYVISEMVEIGLEKEEIEIFIQDSFEKYTIPEPLQNIVNSVFEEQMSKKFK